MSTKKISELTLLDIVNANLELTILPVLDTSSGTTRKVTLQQLNDSIEANIPFAAAAYSQANTATTNAADADQKAVSAASYANSAFSKANNALNVSSGGTISGDLSITGNLSITGCTATLTVSTFRTSDHIIDIGHGTTGAATQNAGIRVLRGDDSPVQLRWNEFSNKWQYTNDGTEYFDFSSLDSNFLNSAFDQANTANVLAQSAYDYANTIVLIDSWARDSVNSSSSYSNSAFFIANTANTNSITAGEYANAAFAVANSASSSTDSWARDAANSASSYANSSYNQANTTNIIAQAAFDAANNISTNVTGNISIASTNSAINFIANSSGDNLGASTLELIPDENLTGTDQYLIIDPTAPGHIHIRAGGTQDSSGAELFLGGENSHVKIGAGFNPPVTIKANTYNWNFDVNGELTVPGKIYFDNGIESALTLDQFGIRANTQLTLSAENYVTGNNSTILFDKNGSGITFRLEDNTPVSKNWGFYQDKLTFPDSTEQTTAFTINPTVNILKINDGVHEQFQSKADATGTVEHDCSFGHIFYHISPDANWTVNLTNLNLSSTYATTVTIIIVQGGTGYYPNAVQIGGVNQTINWQGNTTPTPSTNRTDVVTFSILNTGTGYVVFGQLTGF